MVTSSHTIFYVKNISKAIDFYESVFGSKLKFIHESNQYAEIETGITVIAFASEELGKSNFSNGYIKHDMEHMPLACGIVFTVSNVEEFYEKALNMGGITVALPEQKPWGPLVAYVKDPNGVLIAIVSQM